MRHSYLLLLLAGTVFFSCSKEKQTNDPPSSPPPSSTVLIKDIVIAHLPSPYYHFEYNAAGKVTFVSFASELTRYDVSYNGDKISELRNNILVNKDRLQYFYDNAGRVSAITYADSTGIVYTRVYFTYDGQKLIKLEREHKSGPGFILEKTMTFSYHADGNLLDLTVHYPAIVGAESTFTDRYEQYDSKINAQGFNLLHDEFFDHFVFLPGVQLQKNNPGKQTRTGDGDNFKVDYTYTYNDRMAPLTRSGDFVYTSGPNTGLRAQLSSIYTYYP